MIGIDQNPKYSVTNFICQAYPFITKLITDFYFLFDSEF